MLESLHPNILILVHHYQRTVWIVAPAQTSGGLPAKEKAELLYTAENSTLLHVSVISSHCVGLLDANMSMTA